MAMNDGGPHVQIAAFCEKAIRAQGGGLSLISVVEAITQTAVGPDAPDEMPPFSLDRVTLVLTLWAGQTKGRYTIRLRPEQPSGLQREPINLPIQFQETGAKGVDIITQIPFVIEEEGLYWFDVLFSAKDLGDRLLTRIPLHVLYRQLSGT